MRALARWALILGVIIAGFIGIARAVAIRWWRIPENDPWLEASIGPTLRGGDWILLWRATAPHLGDLVLCPEPKHPERVVIGRIVASDSDDVQIDGARVSVDHHVLRTPTSCNEDVFTTLDPETHIATKQHCEMEEIGSRTHQRGDATSNPPPKVTATVGTGQWFLVSDNRQFPYDSRDFGPVDRATCKETVFFRLVGKTGFKDPSTRLTLIR